MPMTPEPAELAARFRLVLTPIVRQLRTQVESDMTPSLMSALATVSREGLLPLGDLAAIEKVTPPMATKLANALEERGLVRRVPCPDDRRVCRLELTTDGRRLLDRSNTRRNAWLAKRFAALTDDERASVEGALEVLERLADEVRRELRR
ncbi:MAG: MarR family winged helix-turn-helix transcriptional regulator [Acidimicrobiales bacterium]